MALRAALTPQRSAPRPWPLYGLYEFARGLVVGNASEAERHAHRLVALEWSLHLFDEADLQHATNALPGLVGVLGTAYLTLHLTVTVAVLLWRHQRRPAGFAFVRTTLLIAPRIGAMWGRGVERVGSFVLGESASVASFLIALTHYSSRS